MRIAMAMVFCSLLSACSIFDQIVFNGPPKRDPTKVYLDKNQVLSVGPRETYKYACVGGPMLCEHGGVTFECRCP